MEDYVMNENIDKLIFSWFFAFSLSKVLNKIEIHFVLMYIKNKI